MGSLDTILSRQPPTAIRALGDTVRQALETLRLVSRNVARIDPTTFGLMITAGLLAIAGSSTFAEMWLRWFPAWHAKGAGLLERFTAGDSYYTHAPLVPVISIVMAVYIYRRVAAPVRRARWSALLGWQMLTVFLLAHLTSVYARVTFVSGFALVGALGGLVLLWGGRPLARAYWVPVALLVFMVPLPMDWIADLNLALKTLAGRAAMWLTVELLGVPAVMDGSYVYLLPDANGTPKVLVIENVCSGLRNLISLIWFASLFVAGAVRADDPDDPPPRRVVDEIVALVARR